MSNQGDNFNKDDRKLLRDIALIQIEVNTDMKWVKEQLKTNIIDKLIYSKTTWIQRAINVIFLFLICGVASYPDQVKVFCKSILKWFGFS